MLKVAISGLNNTDNPAPGIPVAKSLKGEYGLIGFSYDPNEPGNYQSVVEKTYLMPYPSLGIEELKHRLEHIKQQEAIDVIIPNLDVELPLYIKYQQDIEDELGIKMCLPTIENFELRNKNRLKLLSERLQITYPETIEVNTLSQLEKVMDDEKLKFPVMIKGNYYKAYKVNNLEMAKEAFQKIANEWGVPILLQEVVKGEEVNLVGVGDGKGNLKGAVAIKKLTTTETGKIWTGITIQNEKLMQVAKDFVAMTSWRGPFELECMMNMQHIYMIEINPRFPAWVYFATDIGVNLPKIVMEIIEGKEVAPVLNYPDNKMYVRIVDEFVTDFTHFMQLLSKKELSI